MITIKNSKFSDISSAIFKSGETISKTLYKIGTRGLINYDLLETDYYFNPDKYKFTSASPLDLLSIEDKEKIGREGLDYRLNVFFPTSIEDSSSNDSISYFSSLIDNKNELFLINVPEDITEVLLYSEKPEGEEDILITLDSESKKSLIILVTYETKIPSIDIRYKIWESDINGNPKMSDYTLRRDYYNGYESPVKTTEDGLVISRASGSLLGNDYIGVGVLTNIKRRGYWGDRYVPVGADYSRYWDPGMNYGLLDNIVDGYGYTSISTNNEGNLPYVSPTWLKDIGLLKKILNYQVQVIPIAFDDSNPPQIIEGVNPGNVYPENIFTIPSNYKDVYWCNTCKTWVKKENTHLDRYENRYCNLCDSMVVSYKKILYFTTNPGFFIASIYLDNTGSTGLLSDEDYDIISDPDNHNNRGVSLEISGLDKILSSERNINIIYLGYYAERGRFSICYLDIDKKDVILDSRELLLSNWNNRKLIHNNDVSVSSSGVSISNWGFSYSDFKSIPDYNSHPIPGGTILASTDITIESEGISTFEGRVLVEYKDNNDNIIVKEIPQENISFENNKVSFIDKYLYNMSYELETFFNLNELLEFVPGEPRPVWKPFTHTIKYPMYYIVRSYVYYSITIHSMSELIVMLNKEYEEVIKGETYRVEFYLKDNSLTPEVIINDIGVVPEYNEDSMTYYVDLENLNESKNIEIYAN